MSEQIEDYEVEAYHYEEVSSPWKHVVLPAIIVAIVGIGLMCLILYTML